MTAARSLFSASEREAPLTAKLTEAARYIRALAIASIYHAGSGHPGGSLGCTEFLTALYFSVMQRKEGFDMTGVGEDRFFLGRRRDQVLFAMDLRRRFFSAGDVLGRDVDLGGAVVADRHRDVRIDREIFGQTFNRAVADFDERLSRWRRIPVQR